MLGFSFDKFAKRHKHLNVQFKQGMTQQQVADELGVSRETVNRTLNKCDENTGMPEKTSQQKRERNQISIQSTTNPEDAANRLLHYPIMTPSLQNFYEETPK